MSGFPKYALALWLLGAAAYSASTLTFIRAIDVFGTDRGLRQMAHISAQEGSSKAHSEQDAIEPDQPGKSQVSSRLAASNAASPGPTAGNAASASESNNEAGVASGVGHPSAEWVEVVSAVNMRSGPSTSSRVLTVQPAGTKLQVSSRDGGWIEVTDPETGEQGWIYKRYLLDL